MKLITCLSVALALAVVAAAEQQPQKVLRRIIKSTPTASNLGRIRQVTVRSVGEKGAVTEISSKEAASFGQRANETAPVKTKSSSTTTTTTSTTTTTQAPPTTSQAPKSGPAAKASERQVAPQPEVELLSSAPSSWQTMTAVEAPAAMLISTGIRTAEASSSSSSTDLSSSSSNSDLLRASSSTKGATYSSNNNLEAVGESFSRLRQQQSKQSFFYPQQPARQTSKTSSSNTKTHWYQASSTTPRPAPLVQQEEQQQHYEQQYVEQQAEYNAAPPGQAEPFAFDFKTSDSNGNGQYRKEESDKDGVVHGSYGYTDANGIYRHVDYVADRDGFRANIRSNEPGLMAETPTDPKIARAESQPASIQLASDFSPARLTNSDESGESGSWSGELNNAASAAAAPPNFESSHKPERIRAARHFNN